MDNKANEMTDYITRAFDAAHSKLKRHWPQVGAEGRSFLQSTGMYSNGGDRISDGVIGDYCDDEVVDRFEYSFGVILLCLEADVPSVDRSSPEKFAESIDSISSDILSSEVLQGCSFFAQHSFGRDPHLLRLSIRALARHQLAKLACEVGPKRGLSPLLAFVAGFPLIFIFYGLLTASPWLAAKILANIGFGGDEKVLLLGTYGLAALGVIWRWGKSHNAGLEAGTPAEQAYLAWLQFLADRPVNKDGDWLACGVGARMYLSGMLSKGIPVPPLAFDLCAALEKATLGVDSLTATTRI